MLFAISTHLYCLCLGDPFKTVCCQRGYPAIVLTKGGSSDQGGGDRAEDYDTKKGIQQELLFCCFKLSSHRVM